MMWNFYQMSWFWPLCAVTGLILLSLGLVLFSRWFSNNVDQGASRRRHRTSFLRCAARRWPRGGGTLDGSPVTG